ncbi:MAG: squalene synthase HpnC [Rhodoferax sp.]|nr:squalene synthase HpnC [Rhodoferax sp.]
MSPAVTKPLESAAPVNHYENFPVASWLCPPHLRPAIAAIYWFARTADDLADEGDAPPASRLSDLAAYQADLTAIAQGHAPSERWPHVFVPLGRILRDFQLPIVLLEQLLQAFEQDVRYTASGRRYQDDRELQDYCRLSANPVGRLLLHLYGIHDDTSLQQSDHICTALQLINFWQDISVDVPRARWYASVQTMQRFGVQDADFQADSDSSYATQLIANYTTSAREMMLNGAPLACRVPGRAGWELRLVVQGGLRILDKIEAMNFATWRARPKMGWLDAPVLLWRAWRMG